MLAVLGTLFGQGLLHGVGPDHCLAIGALASRGGLRRALAVSVRFGVGHTVVLGALALAALLAGVAIPARWEAGLEVVGGVSLLVVGCWTLLSGGPATAPHHHGDGVMHSHDLGQHGDGPAPRPATSLAAGAVFGLSGVRGLVLSLPLVARRSAWASMAGVLLFGVGVVVSMMAVGFLTQRVAVAARTVERALRLGVGLASVACGAWWIVDHLG